MSPLALFAALGLGYVVVAKPSGSSGGPKGKTFVNGMPADRNLPDDTFAAVNAALVQQPQTNDATGWATLGGALANMAALLVQNYPKAAAAVQTRAAYCAAKAQQLWQQPSPAAV